MPRSAFANSFYKPATGGHAPGDLRAAFIEAIQAYEGWETREPEPVVDVRERSTPLASVCGLLWNCHDIMPGDEARALQDLLPLDANRQRRRIGTYAQGARALKAAVIAARP